MLEKLLELPLWVNDGSTDDDSELPASNGSTNWRGYSGQRRLVGV
jgi:hypothetical protein